MTIANVEMAQAWDGEEGERWAEYAERYEAAGTRTWKRFLERAPVQTGDDVLDVGCGTGSSTRDVARLVAPGRVLGIDLSSRMLGRARRRCADEGLSNVAFEQADAQVHPFDPEAFDVAISSFGVMFFADPVAAFANIGRALRPGSRLALLTWRDLRTNPWITTIRDALAAGRTLPEPPPDAPGPFGLARPDHVRAVLGGAGFTGVELEPVDEPVWLGRDGDDAWSFVRTMGIVKGLSSDLDADARERAFAEVRSVLSRAAGADGVLLPSAAWLVTARRPG